MNIIKLGIGDTVELKKPHPCGGKLFEILRLGSDVRIVCLHCGHDMTIAREKLDKAIKKHIPKAKEDKQ